MREAGRWLYYFCMKPTQSLGNNLWLRNRSLKRWRQIWQEPPSCLKPPLQPLSSPSLEIRRLFKLFPNNAIEDEATVLKRGGHRQLHEIPPSFFSVLTWSRFPIVMLRRKDRKRLWHLADDGMGYKPLGRSVAHLWGYREGKEPWPILILMTCSELPLSAPPSVVWHLQTNGEHSAINGVDPACFLDH